MTGDERSITFKTNRVAIIGCGNLGRRIALIWYLGGVPVTIYDSEPQRAVEALNWVQVTGDSASIPKEKIQHVEIASTLSDAVQGTWMVIESVPEKIALKMQVLGEIDKLAHPMTIISTSSSSFRSSRLVSAMSDERQSRFLNTHYYLPPEIRIVELMTCGRTSVAVINYIASRFVSIALKPITVRQESTGFVGSRMWAAIQREVMFMLAEGVSSVEDIDRVFKANTRAACGPCELMDTVGLQTVCDVEDVYIEERNMPTSGVDFIRQNYVAKGHLGQGTGRGLMEYPLNPQPAVIRDQLLGTWELKEWATMDTNGHQQHPMGNHVQGILIYTSDGYVSVTMQLPGQKPFGGRDPRAGTDSELAEACKRFISYTGTFYTEEDPSTPTVVHRVQCCNFPILRGQSMRRFVAINSVGVNKMLTLTCDEVSMNLDGGRDILRWHKVTPGGHGF